MQQRRTDLPGMAAERMHKLPPYLFGEINAARDRLLAEGHDVIDLGMGSPTDPPPETAVAELKKCLDKPGIHRYSAAKGIPALKEAVARFYDRTHGVKLDPVTETLATVGSKEGISHMWISLLNPGDVVLMPVPAFPPHLYAPMLAGGTSVGIPFPRKTEDLLDKVEELCRTLVPRPKVLVLCFPHNPTGRTVDLPFYEKAVAMAKQYGFYILSDIAYGLTVFEGYRAPSVLQVPGGIDVAVEFFTMSKPWSMAGWRVGYGVGNRDLLYLLASIKGYYDYSLFAAIQQAAAYTLDHCDEDHVAQAAIYEKRLNIMVPALKRMGFELEKPRGGMFVWADLPKKARSTPSIEFAFRMMEEIKVVAMPGGGFGSAGEGAFRLAIVEPAERIKEAMDRMEDWFARL
ncbi:MAG: aminotransferase class I/II-fold pyridoxal phosphate-dependent enzyme [Planctomycetes bacterium]|nr:aminotransferase class I/II-fold pyridoxal phosphate-dependent enzyme [Planctomycetota bacterium]